MGERDGGRRLSSSRSGFTPCGRGACTYNKNGVCGKEAAWADQGSDDARLSPEGRERVRKRIDSSFANCQIDFVIPSD